MQAQTGPIQSSDNSAIPAPFRIAVVGANGHTGRRVVEELRRRGEHPGAVVRNLPTDAFPAEVELRRASADAPDTMKRAIEGARVVINCAGPFLDTAQPVAFAATANGAHYLDISAEQQSVRNLYDSFAEAPAAGAPVLMPGMGFFGGFADLLAEVAVEQLGGADEIAVMIALDGWHPTEGTRRTGARNVFARVVVEDGRLEPQTLPPTQTDWDFPAPFGRQEMMEVPLSEIVVMARHIRCRSIHTFLNTAPLRDLRDPASPPPVPVDTRGRSAQRFVMQVRARKGNTDCIAEGAGQDIYTFTAPLVCEAALRLLDPRPDVGGLRAPAELFPPAAFLDALTTADPAFSWRLV